MEHKWAHLTRKLFLEHTVTLAPGYPISGNNKASQVQSLVPDENILNTILSQGVGLIRPFEFEDKFKRVSAR